MNVRRILLLSAINFSHLTPAQASATRAQPLFSQAEGAHRLYICEQWLTKMGPLLLLPTAGPSDATPLRERPDLRDAAQDLLFVSVDDAAVGLLRQQLNESATVGDLRHHIARCSQNRFPELCEELGFVRASLTERLEGMKRRNLAETEDAHYLNPWLRASPLARLLRGEAVKAPGRGIGPSAQSEAQLQFLRMGLRADEPLTRSPDESRAMWVLGRRLYRHRDPYIASLHRVLRDFSGRRLHPYQRNRVVRALLALTAMEATVPLSSLGFVDDLAPHLKSRAPKIRAMATSLYIRLLRNGVRRYFIGDEKSNVADSIRFFELLRSRAIGDALKDLDLNEATQGQEDLSDPLQRWRRYLKIATRLPREIVVTKKIPDAVREATVPEAAWYRLRAAQMGKGPESPALQQYEDLVVNVLDRDTNAFAPMNQ